MVTGPVRVVVQDRRRLLREGLAELLGAEPDIDVVAAVAHGREVLVGLDQVDAVLLSESDESSFWSGTRAVRFTGGETASSLIGALRGAAPRTGRNRPLRKVADPSGPRLTPREAQVMRSVADGLSTEQIAATLGIAGKSVDNHKQRMFAKLGAQNGAHAVALEAGYSRADLTKVVVADPSRSVRDVLARTFDGLADVDVVASVGSLSELLARCRRCSPDVVLAGTTFADGDLVELLPDVLLAGARVLVIGDASVGAADAVSPLLFAGASGCLFVQDAGPDEVVAATRQVAAGNASLHPAAAAAVLRQWRATRSTPPDRTESPPDAVAVPQLTRREAEVLAALARGLPTKTIGRELAVSPKTVDAHIARLLAKLGVRNRAQAVSVALEYGLLESRDSTPPASQVSEGGGRG